MCNAKKHNVSITECIKLNCIYAYSLFLGFAKCICIVTSFLNANAFLSHKSPGLNVVCCSLVFFCGFLVWEEQESLNWLIIIKLDERLPELMIDEGLNFFRKGMRLVYEELLMNLLTINSIM